MVFVEGGSSAPTIERFASFGWNRGSDTRFVVEYAYVLRLFYFTRYCIRFRDPAFSREELSFSKRQRWDEEKREKSSRIHRLFIDRRSSSLCLEVASLASFTDYSRVQPKETERIHFRLEFFRFSQDAADSKRRGSRVSIASPAFAKTTIGKRNWTVLPFQDKSRLDTCCIASSYA